MILDSVLASANWCHRVTEIFHNTARADARDECFQDRQRDKCPPRIVGPDHSLAGRAIPTPVAQLDESSRVLSGRLQVQVLSGVPYASSSVSIRLLSGCARVRLPPGVPYNK